jgi:tetratricopeptide (TPR) repeat protein
MSDMWILGLLLLFQNPNQVAPPSGNPLGGVYRINGRIVVDRGEIPIVDVRLVNNNTIVAQTVQSFANGTFFFNNVALGRYTIEISDSRYSIATVQVWYRDAEETAQVVTMRLTRNDSGSKPTSETAELDKLVQTLSTDARVNGPALDEFRKGVEALRLRSKDNPPDAHFKKAIELFPDFHEAYYQLGLEAARQKHPAEAIAALEKATTLNPKAPLPLSTLGRLYVESGRFEQGVATLVKIGSIGELSADDRYFMGVALYKLDKTVPAQQQFEMSIIMAPNKYPGAYVQLSNAYSRNGNPEAALGALETYLKLFPNDPNHKAVEDGAQKLKAAIQKAKP